MNRTASHLSNLVVLALVALLLGPSPARADSTPISLQFLHPISTSRDPDTDTSVRLSLLWARSGTVKALDLGLVATGTSGDMRGLQLVGFYGGGNYYSQSAHILGGITRELGSQPQVVATGGLADLWHRGIDAIDHVDIHLTLKGLRLFWERCGKPA